MKRIFLISTFILLYGPTAFAQDNSQHEAWKIIYQTRVEPLPGASEAQIKKAKEISGNLSSMKRRVLLSDSLYRIDRLMKIGDEYHSTYSLIVSRRDSVVYSYDGSKNAFIKQSYASYFKMVNKESDLDFMNRQNHLNSGKTILGWHTQKLTFSITSSSATSSDTLRSIIWYSTELPTWFVKDFNRHNLPGVPIRTITIPVSSESHLKFIDEVVKIVPIKLEHSDYLPPEGAKIIEKDAKKQNRTIHTDSTGSG